MRRQLLRQLPRMSEQFSITPTVFWALTWDEYRAYLDHIEATDRAMENATDGS